ncbi:MAG: nicotinamide-nucleotide amidohydrolase family protein [Bacteroidetes bacterium]|nr:nicotinamide-nucleotide amidohydrolase family protein [Bacteroidota bacterium]
MHHITNKLVQTLRKEDLTLALAESMTCGLAAHQLSTCIGTSEVLIGSIVCYSPLVKTSLLGISEKTIQKYTAESQEVTDQLARGLKKLIRADIHAALTGLAAPGGSETRDKPVGTVFISVLYQNKLYNERKRFRGSPTEVRKKASRALYQLILTAIRPAFAQE